MAALLKPAIPSRSRIPSTNTLVAKTIVGRIHTARASKSPITIAFLPLVGDPVQATTYTAAIMINAVNGSEKKYPEYGKIRVPKATQSVAINALLNETPSRESVRKKNAMAAAAAKVLVSTAPNT